MHDPVPVWSTGATPIAVVIATRGHHLGAARAAASVLTSRYPAFELCVVDQSDDTLSPELLRLAGDDRVQIVKAPPHGLGAARNLGVNLTRAPIVAFTDDDCLVEPGWLEGLAAAFAQDRRVGLVFGSVCPAPYDRTAGFIPAYEVPRPLTARGVGSQSTVCGIGACMAIRRSTFDVLHGFDERLGAGTELRAAEDHDIVVRALLAGHWVHETPAAIVTHFGFRTWRDGRAVIQGYMLGLGASQAKMLRLGGAKAIKPILDLGWRWLAHGPVVDLNHTPPRLLRLRAFLAGAWSGLLMPIDPVTGCFSSRVRTSSSRLTIGKDASRRHSPVRNA